MNIKQANEILKQIAKSHKEYGKDEPVRDVTKAIDTLTRFVDVVTGEPSEDMSFYGNNSVYLTNEKACDLFKAMVKQAEREAVAQ